MIMERMIMGITSTERSLREKMKSLHTWKPEFSHAVKICADLMDQYRVLNAGIVSGALPMFDPTETGGTRKSAAVTTAESLRRDILAYMKELGLTALAVKRLDAQENLPESSVLADALRRMGDGP
jgi:hypothetical protein